MDWQFCKYIAELEIEEEPFSSERRPNPQRKSCGLKNIRISVEWSLVWTFFNYCCDICECVFSCCNNISCTIAKFVILVIFAVFASKWLTALKLPQSLGRLWTDQCYHSMQWELGQVLLCDWGPLHTYPDIFNLARIRIFFFTDLASVLTYLVRGVCLKPKVVSFRHAHFSKSKRGECIIELSIGLLYGILLGKLFYGCEDSV